MRRVASGKKGQESFRTMKNLARNLARVEIRRKDRNLLISRISHRIRSGKPLHHLWGHILYRRRAITLYRRQANTLHRRQAITLLYHREATHHLEHRRQDCLTYLSQERSLHLNDRGGSCHASALILIHETSGTTADQLGTM
jgi:hypothetical protein